MIGADLSVFILPLVPPLSWRSINYPGGPFTYSAEVMIDGVLQAPYDSGPGSPAFHTPAELQLVCLLAQNPSWR